MVSACAPPASKVVATRAAIWIFLIIVLSLIPGWW
jgi:hypothetical protein